MATKRDKWEDIFRALNIDGTKPVEYVTASQIKQTVHEEPRLMASMLSEDKRPKIFRDLGVFILPVSSDKYAIVHGNGYHELEDPGQPRKFQARFPFEMVMLAFGMGETRYLLHAYHSGLLNHFSGAAQMFETMSGKGRTGNFEFRVDGSPAIQVKGAGMEVDKGFESPTEMLLFEAKAFRPKTFLIRQLYYPYRVASDFADKTVRAFFFVAV